ncbi:MAG TPA: PH domain-containing protein [Pseudonocardiaceae bacterium]
MSESSFGYTRRQRRVSLGSALLVAVLTTGLLVGGPIYVVLAPLLLPAYIIVAAYVSSTRIDEHGLRTRSVWRRRTHAWADVADINTVRFNGIGITSGETMTRVGVTLSDGRRFKLPAPYSARRLADDPDFHRKLAAIRGAWHVGIATAVPVHRRRSHHAAPAARRRRRSR